MAVNDFVSLLLGEAGGKTAAERYNDMLHIASVVVNRSLATGLPVEDIIANSTEFNAWGKELPAGTEKYRDIAQQAIKQVMDFGPVTNAAFYATPTKTGNLPSGLQAATRTASHEFFTDPQGRAIGTSRGYAQVSPVNMEIAPPIPLSAPAPYSPLDLRMEPFNAPYGNLGPPTPPRAIEPGAGLANLAPNGIRERGSREGLSFIGDRQVFPGIGLGNLAPFSERAALAAGVEPGQFAFTPGARGLYPASGIAEKVASVANDVMPGIKTTLYSGQERKGQKAVGTPDRHPRGYAGDFHFEKDGERVRDQGVLKDIALEMAARHNANIGIGRSYMGDDRMHIDTMPLGVLPGGPQWGATGNAWGPELDFARQTGTTLPGWGAKRGEAIPTPTPREAGLAMPAVPSSLPNFSGGQSPRAAQQTSMAMYGLGLPPAPPASPPALPFAPETTQAIPAAMTRPGTQGAPMSVPAAPTQAPSIPQSVVDGYRSYGASRAMAPAAEFPALPAVAPTPTPPPQVSIPEIALPQLAPIPTPAPRNSEAAFLGGALGPAAKQIGQNIKTNMQGGRINVLAGIPEAYRDAFRGLGNRMNGIFGGSLPPPTPFSVGRGLSAIEAVRGGGMAPGATAYSNSNPGASWSVNAYGFPEFSSAHGFTGRTPDGF